METKKVSNNFMKFFAKNQAGIEEVKKEEARAANIPVPVGTEGEAIITDMIFDKGKDKKLQDGTIKEGTDYCLMEMRILSDMNHQGKILKKAWYFSTTANATGVDRFGWFLNELENLGFEGFRDVRLNLDNPQQIVDFLLTSPRVVKFSVVEDPYDQREKKAVKLYQADTLTPEVVHTNHVPGTETAPTPQKEVAPTPPVADTVPFEENTVKFLGADWTIVQKAGSSITIKNPVTGKEKTIDVSQLD